MSDIVLLAPTGIGFSSISDNDFDNLGRTIGTSMETAANWLLNVKSYTLQTVQYVNEYDEPLISTKSYSTSDDHQSNPQMFFDGGYLKTRNKNTFQYTNSNSGIGQLGILRFVNKDNSWYAGVPLNEHPDALAGAEITMVASFSQMQVICEYLGTPATNVYIYTITESHY